MDRPIAYTQEQGRSTDFLFAQRSTMIAIAKLSQAAFGSNTVVRGLAVTPNSPAALNVLVGIGEIYTLASVDATTYGSLPADTTDQVVQQGLNMSAQTISTPAPSTAGYSINYLIEAQFQSQDTNPVVLPFYNSANPQQPLNGQGGNGATLPTERQGVCVIQAKAGIAATTGTQVTPSVDSGWTALAVVTVANGQASIGSGNITIPAGVPQISSLLQMLQTGSANYAVDTSASANTISLSLTPSITAYTDGQEIVFKAANTNTGACTINAGGGSVNLVSVVGTLLAGEIVSGKQYKALYSASLGEFVLTGQASTAQVQQSAFNYAGLSAGTANALTATLSPAPTSYTDGLVVTLRVATANTGAATLNVNGLGAIQIIGRNTNQLQGGELAAGGAARFEYSTQFSAWVLVWSCGPLQIAPATQSQHAVQFGQIGTIGQCRLNVISTTQLSLAPYNGNVVNVNGAPLVIPGAGINISNSGLAASTLYYVYLGGTTASPTLVPSTTSYSVASNGVVTQTGNAALTLVGMIYTNSSSQFVDSQISRTCLSWFNRRARSVSLGTTTGYNFTSTTPSEVSTALRIFFLSWADEATIGGITGEMSNTIAGASVSVYSSVDGNSFGAPCGVFESSAGGGQAFASQSSQLLGEGFHTASVYGNVTSGTGSVIAVSNSYITRG